MMEKVQRFGGAMFTPVLLFSFSGIMVALCIIFKNPMLVGSIATEGTTWFSVWSIIEDGAWTVFNQMELLFVIGLAIGLAKKANARAAMEAFVVYTTFNYFVSGMLKHFGSFFGVDFAQEVGGESGLKLLGGIKTLDTGIIGAIIISAIVVYIHDRYFDTKLPDFLGIFQGSSFVVIIGFFVMLPVAFITALIWPKIQMGIGSMQGFLASSGVFGVWLYTFLERILIPTGLHHFIYTPFVFGPAVVEEGISKYWMAHLNEFSQSTEPMKKLFPEGAFALHGNSKIFAAPGISAAFYFTAKPENRTKVLAILIPTTLTAVLAGITEPLEFTFLFISPPLFALHAVLAATMSATMYAFGVVGDMGGGFIDLLAKNWIPLFANHKGMIFTQLLIGLSFTVIYFLIFRFIILKFNIPTPGRELAGADVKLYSKKEFKEKQAQKDDASTKETGESIYMDRAIIFLEAFGGSENIEKVANCATRLRITVKDETKVHEDAAFKSGGAHGVVRKGNAFQVIVGLDVPQVREQFEKIL
ncbi:MULTISPECIES: alpha-glucoside-specific PTS transporter subunit IIBC [Vagococcus]|uniref:PTS system, maltose and glucose-specific IIC component / PTS system, maltose and glucose-specific IIB component n=1 Tax=Vagococcus fluvialis bH819 TaxID=1255619 RepID=A0A1X6WUE9_9ENTE|nr:MULTISPECIES: alpha-glucoside-specific PTS transporter subunit IIBC [Vagococcus]SLM87246.1 PTS system, maltose and glucose-specific IIC component / PTS system, maltose and glucose-specific IIB component [Vagococcus fluvialis bH819]HCM89088.1 alpha-glucoside-specific phosphotransferase enzyme IIB component [Vagococcus sp.]